MLKIKFLADMDISPITEVWQKAMKLVVECYQQLQRAAVAIPANIAEGRGRQHVSPISVYSLWLSCRIGDSTTEIGKMLNGLRRSLQKTVTS